MARGDWLINKEDLCERLSISTDFFDDYFRDDPRVTALEIRKIKIWWETDKINKVAIEIMYEISN